MITNRMAILCVFGVGLMVAVLVPYANVDLAIGMMAGAALSAWLME